MVHSSEMSLILLLTSLSRDNRNLFGLSGRLGKTPQMYSLINFFRYKVFQFHARIYRGGMEGSPPLLENENLLN